MHNDVRSFTFDSAGTSHERLCVCVQGDHQMSSCWQSKCLSDYACKFQSWNKVDLSSMMKHQMNLQFQMAIGVNGVTLKNKWAWGERLRNSWLLQMSVFEDWHKPLPGRIQENSAIAETPWCLGKGEAFSSLRIGHMCFKTGQSKWCKWTQNVLEPKFWTSIWAQNSTLPKSLRKKGPFQHVLNDKVDQGSISCHCSF